MGGGSGCLRAASLQVNLPHEQKQRAGERERDEEHPANGATSSSRSTVEISGRTGHMLIRLHMRVAELWGYPVKSLAGERPHETELTAGGIPRDRLCQVRRADGSIVDARANPRMLALHPILSSDGVNRGESRIDMIAEKRISSWPP